MILGTYWYFAFPTGLYEFDYFEFRQGYSGYADNPAQLITNIEVEQPEKIITKLKSLIEIYDEGFVFIYQKGHKLKIGTGSHQLFDYDFLLIAEIEKVLKKEKIKLAKDQKLDNPILLRLQNENSSNKIIYPKKKILQIVGSEIKKHNAENSKLRLDCNLRLADKENFIVDLNRISREENLEVFFYFDNDFKDRTNLMLFFTNGRQGLDLKKKNFVNTLSFENKIEKTMLSYRVKNGHIGGFEFFPQNGPKIERIIEKEYII